MKALMFSLPPEIAEDVRRLGSAASRGKAVMRYNAELKRAYWLQHGDRGLITCITFDAVATVEQDGALWEAIDAAPKPLRVEDLSELYSKVTGLQVKSLPAAKN
jgi:hypothetical protein